MKKGLILVDIQNDYFKGGRHELVNPEQAAKHAYEILSFFRKFEWPVYHVQHISLKQDASFFLPDTPGVDFYDECRPLDQEEIIIKHKPDSFLNTSLKEKLEEKEIDTLLICGMMTHMCIDTTVRSASNHGYSVELIEDACATRDLEWRDVIIPAEQVQSAFMAALDGTFAKVFKGETWLSQTLSGFPFVNAHRK